MRIHLKKGRDGPASLTCIRRDGTRTWARERDFFPLHDVTHYAVESVLGFDEAFLGLIAAGWYLEHLARPGAAARLPFQARVTEQMVGLLDRERSTPERWTVAGLNEVLQTVLAPADRTRLAPLTEAQLHAIRELRSRLESRWHALAQGESLDLGFPEPASG